MKITLTGLACFRKALGWEDRILYGEGAGEVRVGAHRDLAGARFRENRYLALGRSVCSVRNMQFVFHGVKGNALSNTPQTHDGFTTLSL